MDINELYRERQQYYNLKSDLNSVLAKLYSADEALQNALLYLKNAYSGNGEIIGKNNLEKNILALEQQRNKINGVILPAINQEINKINIEIEKAELELT